METEEIHSAVGGNTSDKDFEIIVDISPIPILIHNMGVIRYANSLCLEMFEVPEYKQFIGRNLLEFIDPADRPQVIDAIARGAKEKVLNSIVAARIVTAKGNGGFVETKSSSIHFRGEECRLVVAHNFDYVSKVEKELKSKNLLIEKIAQLIPDNLIVVESKSRKILFQNNSLLEFLGYNEADLEGKVDMFDFMQNIIHNDDKKKLIESRKFLFDPANVGKYTSTEYRMLGKDGKWRWILGRSTMLQMQDDQQVNFGIAQDITLLKETEQELRESRNFNEKIADTIPNHVAIFDLTNRNIIYHNFYFGELLGYTAENRLSNMFEYFEPEYVSTAMEQWSKIPQLKDGEIFTSIDRYLTKDGKRKFLLSRVTPFSRDENGQVKQILTTTIDISDVKEAEAKLKASEAARRAILDALPDMVFQVNVTGDITGFYSNLEFQRLLQYSDLTGKNIRDILPAVDAEKVVELVNEAVERDEMRWYDYRHHLKDDIFSYEFRIVRLNEMESIIVARNVTLLRNAQVQLDKQVGELSRKNRELEKYITSNTELEKFAYIASHDLREPVRSIVGFAQLLQKRNADKLDRESQEFLNNIIDSGQRMNSLIHGLLDYSRISTAGKSFDKIDLSDLLKKVLSDLKVAIEETGAQIVYDRLPAIYADSLQIRQLFQNLLSNSIKFRKADVAPIIKISAEEKAEGWLFKVEDNGIGLDMKFKDKVFQIFNRLHSGDKYQGSGIGLAICKRIVERHKGEIWIDSAPGYGTTFYFTLPAEA